MSEIETLQRVVHLAKGCHDYRGVYRDQKEAVIFHHGIQTVVNVMEAALKRAQTGERDSQLTVLETIGRIDQMLFVTPPVAQK